MRDICGFMTGHKRILLIPSLELSVCYKDDYHRGWVTKAPSLLDGNEGMNDAGKLGDLCQVFRQGCRSVLKRRKM